MKTNSTIKIANTLEKQEGETYAVTIFRYVGSSIFKPDI